MDEAAILSEIHRRNEIRREARLPLLDVGAEFDHAANESHWREFHEACDRHAEDKARIRAEVLEELRAKHGPGFGHSMGGRWMIGHHTNRRFHALLAELGHRRPQFRPRHAVTYGSDAAPAAPSAG